MANVINGKVRAGSANSRRTCFIVAMREQHAGSGHGKWRVCTNCGYIIVCPSRKEADEFVLRLGATNWAPQDVGLPIDIRDEQYLEWLLQHHVKVAAYEPRGSNTFADGADHRARECTFAAFIHGWIPSEAELLIGVQTLGANGDPFRMTHEDL